MSAVRLESPRIQWLLAVAAFCMLAQSTLLPFVSEPAGAWAPVHRHLTLNGVVPEHTHEYDRDHDADHGASGCVVTAAASTADGEAHNEALVCAPDDGSATTSVTATVQHEPASVRLVSPGIEWLIRLSEEGAWSSIVPGTLTPPPRSQI